MDRNRAKQLLPVIQAYINGKPIQSRCIKGDTSLWYDDEDPSFDDDFEYRIKPKSEYRPFKNAEECWTEMKKHEPFGWVIKHNENKMLIGEVDSFGGVILYNQRGSKFDFDEANRILTFVDGTPFGVKVEE